MKKNIQQKKPNPYESYGLMSVCNFSRKISFVFVGEEEEEPKRHGKWRKKEKGKKKNHNLIGSGRRSTMADKEEDQRKRSVMKEK